MKQETLITRKIQVRTYSVKEVADLYCISNKTLKKWLKPFENELGERMGYFYNPKQVRIIFEKLGLPGVINLN